MFLKRVGRRVREEAEIAIADVLVRLRLPQWRYATGNVQFAPFSKGLRYAVSSRDTDEVEARMLNLSMLIDVLEASSIEYFLVDPGWSSQVKLAVPASARTALAHALSSWDNDPIYLKSVAVSDREARPRRAGRGVLEPELGAAFLAFCYRLDTERRLRFGHDTGCRIEFWIESEGELHRPEEFGPHVSISAEARRRPHVESVLGLEAPVHGPPPDAGIFDVDFPIDVVYMWVDGDEPSWQKRREGRLGEASEFVAGDARQGLRSRQFDELRYSLRSLERYAPWVRNVYLVTDQQRPSWLDEVGTNLTVVDHKEILPTSALPTFNSHAISARLHKIPGLAEHFLVLNDDVFFGRLSRPELFFHSNGVARFFLSSTRINHRASAPHECARVNSCELIEAVTGYRPERVMKHTPVAFLRSLLSELEEEFSERWSSTVQSPFRSEADIVPEYLHHYIGYSRRRTTPGSIRYGYFGFGSAEGMQLMDRHRRYGALDVYCVNDLGGEVGQLEENRARLQAFLQEQFPHRSKYELP